MLLTPLWTSGGVRSLNNWPTDHLPFCYQGWRWAWWENKGITPNVLSMDGCNHVIPRAGGTIQTTTIPGAELVWRNRNKIVQLPVLEIQTEMGRRGGEGQGKHSCHSATGPGKQGAVKPFPEAQIRSQGRVDALVNNLVVIQHSITQFRPKEGRV